MNKETVQKHLEQLEEQAEKLKTNLVSTLGAIQADKYWLSALAKEAEATKGERNDG